ncbi:hypothetical protein M8J76_013886 [Diaphorina citri]|nr:hypothetical protein M8J76_003800 [Diaphorina citri]KAI5733617.1 hypothetical protein M8J76_013886 [Diaphorina citri]
MAYPHSMRKVLRILNYTGIMNHLVLYEARWKQVLHRVFCVICQVIGILSLISHILSTTTRSRRFLPEFLQRMLEDTCFISYSFEYLNCKYRMDEFLEIVTRMENTFSSVDKTIVKNCHRTEINIYLSFSSLLGLALLGSIIETYLPISNEELAILERVYRRKYPENRLETNFWVPFDDSDPKYYHILFYFIIFLILRILVMSLCVAFLPVLITQITGQYKILNLYIRNIGADLDDNGLRKYFTNIERGEFIYADVSKKSKNIPHNNSPQETIKSNVVKLKRQVLYEKLYVRQIIRFHQRIIHFEERVFQFFKGMMVVKVIANNMLVALCLYQLTSPEAISKERLYKLFFEFLAFSMQYFYLCHCSELLDNCNINLRTAIIHSFWYKNRDLSTRRDLTLMILRAQRRNHVKFYKTFCIGHTYFINVLKYAVNFVNFVTLSRKNT